MANTPKRKPSVKGRYTLIKGNFYIHNAAKPRQGPQPDGDTVSFALDPAALDVVLQLPRFSGRPPEIRSGRISIRYEGIDTLETHFQGMNQDLVLAHAARDANLAKLGFRRVVFFSDLPEVVQSVAVHPLPGYVLANGIESNGRMLGLVYVGTTTRALGDKVFVDSALLNRSVNAKLVANALAYVEPYDSMPQTLVKHLRTLVHTARKGKIHPGLWTAESITRTKSARLRGLTDLESLVMWPKLFRRLATYFDEGHVGLADFDQWIRDDPIGRDDTLRLPDGEAGNIHDTYAISGDRLKLRFNPEDLLITPDPKPQGSWQQSVQPDVPVKFGRLSPTLARAAAAKAPATSHTAA